MGRAEEGDGPGQGLVGDLRKVAKVAGLQDHQAWSTYRHQDMGIHLHGVLMVRLQAIRRRGIHLTILMAMVRRHG